jgi:hypothetical protein
VSLSLVLDQMRQGKQASLPPTGGVTRGSMGVMGSRVLQSRNPDAQMDRERRRLLQSPVMEAFVRRSRQRLLW